jgi:hypothetical protein
MENLARENAEREMKEWENLARENKKRETKEQQNKAFKEAFPLLNVNNLRDSTIISRRRDDSKYYYNVDDNKIYSYNYFVQR